MSSSRALVFFTLSICIHNLMAPNNAEKDCTSGSEYCWSCSDVGNYSPTSIYKENLNKLLTSISSSPSNDQNFSGFYSTSLGRIPNKVNAIALCRGDLTAEKCQSCLNDSKYRLMEHCPYRKEAILWDERCTLRYSFNDSILSVEEDEPSMELKSPQSTSDAQHFKQKLMPLLDDLVNNASSGDSLRKYAYGHTTGPNAESIYALLQCTPDLSQKECNECLQNATSRLSQCCEGRQGARILKPRCNLRYESGAFYGSNDKPKSAGSCTQDAEYCWSCSDVSNNASIGTYEENLKSLLFSFVSSNNAQNLAGFYNSSLGENPNRVYAIALCRGDLSQEDCHSCVNTSSERILISCPSKREAVLWDQRCMVRFSDKFMFSVKIDPRAYAPSLITALDPHLFKLTLKSLLGNLTSKAALGNSLRKYASGESTIPGYETIYATVQCTPDLDKQQCSDCVENANLFIPQCCDGAQGARILKPSCNLRYEVSQFYTDDHHSSQLPPNPSKKGRSSKTTITVVAAVVTTVIVAMLIGICIFLKLRKSADQEKLRTNSEEITWAESLLYDFTTIAAATDDFSEENKLGEGGFGAVYKGRLSDGQHVAVKRLSMTSSQGDQEFKNEVVLVVKLQHRNLVRLLGFCLKEKERLLVYEYVPNSSLDRFIFDPTKRPYFDWDKRYKIIQGISRGLLYLHEDSRLRIIHRDLKASNILLDNEMNPKISDFGMARLFEFDQTQGDTRRIVGTYGYMAPEYAIHGQFSVKSDVYSFGVLLLEIVSGQKISSFNGNGEEVESLLTFAWKNWNDGTASNLIDIALSAGSISEIMRCIHIGLLCVQEYITDRPTMNSVTLMLNSRSLTLAVPSKPAFYMRSTEGNVSGSDNSKSGSVQGSRNEASVSELYPR